MTNKTAEEQILDIILRVGYGSPGERTKRRVRKILKAHGDSERAAALREVRKNIRVIDRELVALDKLIEGLMKDAGHEG